MKRFEKIEYLRKRDREEKKEEKVQKWSWRNKHRVEEGEIELEDEELVTLLKELEY